MDYSIYYHTMPDGTIKQVNPFTGTEVWSVPDRGRKPLDNEQDQRFGKLQHRDPEDYCSFCPTRYREIPPEKARLVHDGDTYKLVTGLTTSQYESESYLFRRVPNLFEIVSLNYWRKNYDYKLSEKQLRQKDRFIQDPSSIDHIVALFQYKLRLQGIPEDDIARIDTNAFINDADAFFGGGHEMIIARRHYKENAKTEEDLCSSGDLSVEEHEQYFRLTIDAMADITENNKYVRYISVFQNWMKAAGASFDHLHKQIVAIDEWGASIERQISMVKQDKNIFNVFGPNFAALNNLIFAENDFAVACVGIGHRHPTIEIYSKSVHARPDEHDLDEVRGMSDLVHACHAALGNTVSSNEEWYYTPFDCIYNMPWHIFIKLRINVQAGFEGGTHIFINPLAPIELRDRVVPDLYDLRHKGRISSDIRIAEECRIHPNILQYYKAA